jgi:putative ABC transport system permease protein
MLRNYLKIAIRNLWKHKLFSFINIFGLAVGMLVCILAIIDVNKALNYDKFHPHSERTFRIVTDMWGRQQQHEVYASAPMPAAGELKKRYEFIDEAVRVIPARGISFSTLDQKTLPAPGFFADPGFFKVFGFSLTEGGLSDAPNTIVITQETAKKFFGNENALGKILINREWGQFVVTGVVANTKQRSHLQFDVLISSSSIPALEQSGKMNAVSADWTNPWGAYTYISVKKGTAKAAIENMMPPLAVTATQMLEAGNPYEKISFRAQPLAAINPSREDMINFPAGTTIGKLLVQLGIGLLTLFLAGFNYVNLTLARSLTRSKEIGVRKVIGAMRWQVFAQFIIESMLIAILAMILAVVFLELTKAVPALENILAEMEWSLPLTLLLVLFGVMTGFVAGYVPARVLSAVKPALVIKGHKVITVLKGITIRKILVIAQFSISLTGIILMAVMYQQQSFMAEGEYGFEKENVLNISLNGQDYKKLTNELTNIPGVEKISPASFTMGMQGGHNKKISRNDRTFYSSSEILGTDHEFIPLMKLDIVAGENLPIQNGDSAGSMVLVNEKTAEALHYNTAAEMIGQQIWLNDSIPVQVIGVVKDFHSMSMFFPIFPMVIRYEPNSYNVLHVRVNEAADQTAILAAADKIWKKINPYEPFNAKWLDKELYDRHFHGDDQWLLGMICAMVLSIACLGLLGMVTFSSEIRTREVGVRKTLGASVNQLLILLSEDFFKLLIIAGCIAVPVGYLLSALFLNNFAYHVSIGVSTLLLSFLGLMILGAVTIGWQTFKVAMTNPVESLREV